MTVVEAALLLASGTFLAIVIAVALEGRGSSRPPA
jgi:hypothetical protein